MRLKPVEVWAPEGLRKPLDLRLPVGLVRRVGGWLLVLATGALAALPVISSTVKAVHAGWVPAGDDGIIATRGWDVLSSHTPLVGQYSEAGLVVHGQVMHSPGPLLYWLLALPARYGSVASLAVTMCVLNTLAIVLCVAIARRRGGLVLMFAAALGIALMSQSLPAEAMHDIWNPAAGLFAFLALIFVGWSLACGDYKLLPLAALLASFVVQTHLMYLAPSALVVAVDAGGLAARALARRRARGAAPREARGRVWPWSLAAVLVIAVCWTAPAIEQLKDSPGNLTMIARTVEHRGHTLGGGAGWHALVRSVGSRPWWLYVPASEWERKLDVRARPSAERTVTAIALLAALATVLVAGAWRRRWELFAAALIALGLCAVMALQVAENPASRLLSETLGYTLWWGSELGLWVWLVLFWALWLSFTALVRALRGQIPPVGRLPGSWPHGPLVPALACVGCLAGLAAVGAAVTRRLKPDSHAYEYRAISTMAAAIERVVGPGQTINYRLGALDTGTQPMEPGLRFLLVRHGDRVFAERSFPRLGSYYVLGRRPYSWTVYLRDGVRSQPHMRLASRVSFQGPWGREVLSAWVHQMPPTAPLRSG